MTKKNPNFQVTWSGSDELKELHPYVERIQITTEAANISKGQSLLKVHTYKLNAQGNYI